MLNLVKVRNKLTKEIKLFEGKKSASLWISERKKEKWVIIE